MRWKEFRTVLANKTLIQHNFFPDMNGINHEYNEGLNLWNPDINSYIMSLKNEKFRARINSNLNMKNSGDEMVVEQCIMEYLMEMKDKLCKEFNLKMFNEMKDSQNVYQLLWAYLLEHIIAKGINFVIGVNDMRFTNHRDIKYNLLYDHVTKQYIPMFLPPHLRFRQLPLEKRLIKFSGGILCCDNQENRIMTLILLSLLNQHDANDPNEQKDQKFTSRGTLLILPDGKHIEKWREMMTKYGIFDKYRACCIEKKHDYRSLTYGEMSKTDFIIISAKFLRSNDYTEFGNKVLSKRRTGTNRKTKRGQKELSLDEDDDIYNMDRNAFIKLFENDMGPNLKYLYFHRIVLVHPELYLYQKRIREVIMDIESKYGWYVSGKKPFRDRKFIGYATDFLEINFVPNAKQQARNVTGEEVVIVEEWNKLLNTPTGYVLHKIIKDYLFAKCIQMDDHDKDVTMTENNQDEDKSMDKTKENQTKSFINVIKRFILLQNNNNSTPADSNKNIVKIKTQTK